MYLLYHIQPPSPLPSEREERKRFWPKKKALQWNNQSSPSWYESSIPDSAGLSSDPKEKKDLSEIEGFKQYVKEYVSDSHNHYWMFSIIHRKSLLTRLRIFKGWKKFEWT